MQRDDIVELLQRFLQKKGEELGILRLGIFGSAARGTMTAESDIDIVVEIFPPDLWVLIGIKQLLEEQLDRPVDIVRYQQKMNPALRERINRDAIYV